MKVIDDLKLADNPAVKERYARLNPGHGTIQDWLADGLRSNLTVEPARESSVLNISFKGDDADYVAKVANAFAAAYQQVSVDLKVRLRKKLAATSMSKSKSCVTALRMRKTACLPISKRTTSLAAITSLMWKLRA